MTSYGGEIRGTKTLYLLRNIVSLQVLVAFIAFFTLRGQLVVQQKYLLRAEEICCEKASAVNFEPATNFGFVARFSSNSQLVMQQIC